MNWRRALLGDAQFPEGQEYTAFKYSFALAMLWVNLPLLGLFIAGDVLGANKVGFHGVVIRGYFALCCALIWLLRGRQALLAPVVWVFAWTSLAVDISGFLFVPADELRLVWFYSLVAGSYILLGRRAGAAIAAVSVVAVGVANGHLAAPVSARGMGTFYASMVSLGVIFHVFTSRSVSFHRAMVHSQARLRHLSDHDPLTGVLNARAFARQCEPLMQLAQRQGGDHSVLFIDLDHFKRVNDQHGHEAGDAVLKAVAAALSQRLRRSDLLGRVGGEEFVAFLPGTDEAGALQLAESLRHDIEALQPASASGLVVPITASIGVASRGAQAESLAVLQQRADVAMYQAKAAGRNRVSRIAGAGPESEEPQGHRPFASHASGAWG